MFLKGRLHQARDAFFGSYKMHLVFLTVSFLIVRFSMLGDLAAAKT